MKKSSKIFVAVISVVCVLSMAFFITIPAVYNAKKRAVIVIPGLLCSAIKDENTNEIIWDPLDSDDKDYSLSTFMTEGKAVPMVLDIVKNTDILTKVADMLNKKEGNMLDSWKLNNNGEAPSNIVPVDWSHEGNNRYGALQAARNPYEYMNSTYGNDANTEVFVFQYDWRCDNRIAAQTLIKTAEEYDEVIIFAHSMGNIVTSLALAADETFRNKVSLYIASAAPYYGSYMALEVLENGEKMIGDLVAIGKDNFSFLNSFWDRIDDFAKTDLLPVFRNFPSMAQLLPTIEQICPDGVNSSLTVNGKDITTRKQLLDYYKTSFWAFDENGEIRPWIATLEDYWNSFYVDDIFSTKLVNTYYIVGDGVATPDHVTVTTGIDHSYSYTVGTHGDGTVPYQSASLNDGVDNLYVMDGFIHNSCSQPSNPEVASVINQSKLTTTPYGKLWRDIKNVFKK